jgi:hypothetical protein
MEVVPVKPAMLLYLVHRWIALVVALQLLAWSAGGLMFSVLDIDDVHGDLERHVAPPRPLDFASVTLTAMQAVERAAGAGVEGTVCRISLRERRGRLLYELYDEGDAPLACVDAQLGDVIRRLSPDAASRSALDDFAPPATVASVTLIDKDAPLEYRGKPLPAYQVVLAHPKHPHIYVSAVTGEVLARRNRPWRIFDFFWMLHIMDYREREDFNHWLLTCMSALAVLTAATGLTLWGIRGRSWLRRGRRLAAG